MNPAMKRRGKRIALLAGAGVLAVAALAGIYWEKLAGWAKFVYLFESIGPNEQGYPEYRHRQTGIIMLRVPGGTFIMGSPAGEEGRTRDELQHEVTLSPYMIAKYELTHEAWKRVMGSAPPANSFAGEGDLHPARGISWNLCRNFCERTGLNFPTESQWEYACRAGSPGSFAGTGTLDEMGWHQGNSGIQTHPVGTKKPNGFGLFDMHGNVSEWCADVMDREFYSAPESSGPDPLCVRMGNQRVGRGGSAFHEAAICRSAARKSDNATDMDSDLGFRPAYYPLP